jgi:beta-galactosidase
MYYGVDYYPEHWPRARWDEDARLMRAAGINVVRLAEFAWALMEPEEGRYDFAWLDEAIALLGAQGIVTVLCTPTATPPAWMCQRYPEIMRVDRHGRRTTFGMRRQYCPTSATYRRLSAGITRVLAERYAANPHVIGWQLDNEFGCHDSTRCYCPECQRAFQAWAQERYGTLEALNETWGARFWSHLYGSWSQIPLPWATTGISPGWADNGVSNPGLELDFWRFSSQQTVSYAEVQADILREVCPQHWVTTNLMGLGFQDIDYHALARPLDFVTWDNYPLLSGSQPWQPAVSHTLMRGLKQKAFWVMEQQAGPCGWQTVSRAPKPGQLRLWAYQAIAHGADGMVFFRWRTCRFNTEEYWHGILDHDGRPRRRYAELQGMGQEIARIGEELVGAESPKQVALLFSYDTSFALQIQPNVEGLRYTALVAEAYRAFYERGYAVDIISPEADLSGYALVVAPALHVLPPAWAGRLVAYVRQGGHLLVGARSGVKEPSNQVVEAPLPGLLAELCGVEVAEYDPLGREGANSLRFEPGEPAPLAGVGALAGRSCAVTEWCDILAPIGAEVVARYEQDYYAGEPALTLNRAGQGWAAYLGAFGGQALMGPIAEWSAAMAGITPAVAPPEGVEVAYRVKDGRTLTFMLNHTGQPQTLPMPAGGTELISQQPCGSAMTLPPYGVAIVAT